MSDDKRRKNHAYQVIEISRAVREANVRDGVRWSPSDIDPVVMRPRVTCYGCGGTMLAPDLETLRAGMEQHRCRQTEGIGEGK